MEEGREPVDTLRARTELLLDLFRAGSVATSERALLDLAVRRIAETLRDAASALVLDPSGEWLHLASAHALDPATEALIRQLGEQPMRATDGVGGIVLRERRAVFLSGGVQPGTLPHWNEAYSPFLDQVGISSLLAAPLRDGDRVFGVIEVARTGRGGEPFTDDDAQLLDMLVGDGSVFATVRARAKHAAAAEREHRRAERERVRARILEAATRAGDDEDAVLQAVVDELAVLGGYASVQELSPDGTTVRLRAVGSSLPRVRALADRLLDDEPHPATEGATGELLRSGRPIFLPDIDPPAPPGFVRPEHRATLEGMRGIVAVPLRHEGRIRGAVGVVRLDPSARAYEEEDLALVETVSGSVAMLLDNAAHRRASAVAAEEARRAAAERDRLATDARAGAATLAAILDASPLAILVVDTGNRVIYWSRGAERQYGYTREEAMGQTPPHFPGSPQDYLAEEWERVRAGEPRLRIETQRRHKDGRLFDMVIHVVPLREPDGSISGIMTVQEDVTEQRRLQAELVQAQKMETIGQLAGGVAHDFNNILTAIIGYADVAHEETREPGTAHLLETIRTAAERAAGLTQQLLAFSRRQVLQPSLVDVNEVIHGVEAILRRLIGEQVDLVVSSRAGLGPVLVDRTQLEQVILNLAVNARDAMPDGGRLILTTELVVVDGAASETHLAMEPGHYVTLSVTDTGVGMDRETREHIFEPFYTTKGVGRGTGLGLSTVYGVVRQSGGHIWVYSEPGIGSTFRIYFPRAEGDPQVLQAGTARQERRVTGTCLLAEDEALLRELAAVILERAGFHVERAATGAEALARAEEMARIDLLVSDVVMPGITGVELARRLRRTRPDLPVVLMSGYADDATAGIGVADRFLQKPFAPSTLVDAALGALRRSGENGTG